MLQIIERLDLVERQFGCGRDHVRPRREGQLPREVRTPREYDGQDCESRPREPDWDDSLSQTTAVDPEYGGDSRRGDEPQQARVVFRSDAAHHPAGHAQHQRAEQVLDEIHPGPGLGQQGARGSADRQERRAHPQAHREQGGASSDHVAALAYEHQCADQCRRDTGGHNERGKCAHDRHSKVAAARLAVAHGGETSLDGSRHLQREEAEHRSGQDHEQRGESDDDPRLLEHRLSRAPAGRHHHPGGGVGERHSQHIHQRQGK